MSELVAVVLKMKGIQGGDQFKNNFYVLYSVFMSPKQLHNETMG